MGASSLVAHKGLICTGETYKNVVKMTFAKGASLTDLSGHFNSSLEGNVRRTIDFHEGDKRHLPRRVRCLRRRVSLCDSDQRGARGGQRFGSDAADLRPRTARGEPMRRRASLGVGGLLVCV